MKKWLMIAMLLMLPTPLWAQEIFIRDGNVYFGIPQARAVQMTTSGLDSDPCLSPDGKSIVFVRDTPGVSVDTSLGDENATELWLVNVDTRKADLLVRGRSDPKVAKTLSGFSSPHLSSDGRTVFFVSSAWVTSGSIQKISLATKEVRFIIDGNSIQLISKGNYKGNLLVDRALIKYDKKGDSLGRDLYLWIVSSDGKAIKEIDQSESNVSNEFRKKYAY